MPHVQFIDIPRGDSQRTEIRNVGFFVQQQINLQVGAEQFNLLCQFDRRFFIVAHHDNYKIESCRLCQPDSLFVGRNRSDARQRKEALLVNFAHEMLKKSIFIFKNKRIVKGGYKKNLLYLVLHHVEINVLIHGLRVEILLQWFAVFKQ